MSNISVLETHGLKKYFGKVQAVDGIDLRVPRGKVYGFLGPNGSGKTTTIGLILGLMHPTSGRVVVFGDLVTPSHTKPLRRVGSLVGAPSTLPYLTAWQNLELLARIDPSRSRKRIDEILEIVDLNGSAHRRVSQFSTGMKQRLGIAMSLMNDPELLILDEPTNGMDPAGMYEVRNLLSNLSSRGITIFISSHLLHEVEQICDRVAVLKQGKVVAEGSVRELLGEQVNVKIRVTSPTQAVPLLQALPGCRDIRTNGATVNVSGVTSQEVIQHLVSNGVIPEEVTTNQIDLESIYLELTNSEVIGG